MLTSQPIDPLRGVFSCRGPFKSLSMTILGTTAGMSVEGEGRGMIAPNEYGFEFISPSWNPETPLMVTVFYEGAEEPLPCNLHRN